MPPSSLSRPRVGREQDDAVFRYIQVLTSGDRGGFDGPTATMASRDFVQSSGKWYIIIEPSIRLNLEPTAYAI